MATTPRRTSRRLASWLGAALLALGAVAAPTAALAAGTPGGPATTGDSVYVGNRVGYSGTGIFPVWFAGAPTGDTPDAWAYCVEHDVDARNDVTGTIGNLNAFLGINYFTNPAVQNSVQWVLTHGFPTLSLTDLEKAVGISNLAKNDAIEATQYAIWRYTDLNFDASWRWETPNSEAVYWYLVNGANAHPGPVEVAAPATASITGPSASPRAGTIAGPFVVRTNQATARVSAGEIQLTDAAGVAIDAANVRDNQAVYLDLRERKTAGTTDVTVSATASGPTGQIVSVPLPENSVPTAEEHAQTIILTRASDSASTANLAVSWSAVKVTDPTVAPTESSSPSGPPTPGSPSPSPTNTAPSHTPSPGTPGSTPNESGAPGTPEGGQTPGTGIELPHTGASAPGIVAGIAALLLLLGAAGALTRRRTQRNG
ncbi:TQXA domain-containing protein [Mycetocola tolaasinivorans]|uniref:TQXA domain-containing protein n=1 Tax=Mycetocola tolaasinivorans TaxID=76635 RepID=A0A3L7AAM1_9MICO|nr:thioester domain-containing protein [Mycetocola tolaasinivorans]RLP76860.1 TQXA domain-containing protein [Mycetocola tolaasinivorans]